METDRKKLAQTKTVTIVKKKKLRISVYYKPGFINYFSNLKDVIEGS